MEGTIDRYLDLLKKSLTHSLWPSVYKEVDPKRKLRRFLFKIVMLPFKKRNIFLCRKLNILPRVFEEGRGWTPYDETMIGFKRLNNLQKCIENVIKEKIPGDLIEAGVWRGGATIFMKGVLEAHGWLHSQHLDEVRIPYFGQFENPVMECLFSISSL